MEKNTTRSKAKIASKATENEKIYCRNYYLSTCKMRWIRHRKLFVFFCFVWLAVAISFYCFLSMKRSYVPTVSSHHEADHIVWWTTMPADYRSQRFCGRHFCTFTAKRKKLRGAKAVLFYAPDLHAEDLPLPRQSHLWALLHDESPRNVAFMPYAEFLRHFNLTSTFSRHSDFPLTTHHLTDPSQLTTSRFLVPIGEKSGLVPTGTPLIAFLQSDCDTMSGREDYVRELMQHMEVDSYGHCLHNLDLPPSLREDYLNSLYHPDLMRFLSRYKFILAIENGVCDDYITEKFWRPLIMGSVPVYFGSPSIKDWAPNNKSAIYISDFPSPKALAAYLMELDADDRQYNSYLLHKYEQLNPISNKLLQKTLLTRDYSGENDNMFKTFECLVCERINEMPPDEIKIATPSHYNCSLPLVYPPMKSSVHNADVWSSIMAVGRCQARLLDKLLNLNVKFTKAEYDKMLDQMVQANECN